MASDGSVAPKERVNIVYRPAIGDAQAEVELPLKLLVLGDFTLRASDQPVEEMKPVSVDKDNFNDVLKAQKLELNIGIESKLDPNAEPGTQFCRSSWPSTRSTISPPMRSSRRCRSCSSCWPCATPSRP